jgi:hypothetical protein
MNERSVTLAQYVADVVQRVSHNAIDVLNGIQDIDK